MFGAILGDMIGSPHEFGEQHKTKNFPLFCAKSRYTDDSVMTIAVADAVSQLSIDGYERQYKEKLSESMRYWGRNYYNAGYGTLFHQWLASNAMYANDSFGNGTAMRVSYIGWLDTSLDKIKKIARWSAEVSHNHPEAVKGAECIAVCIWQLLHGMGKHELRTYVELRYGYDLETTCDALRPDFKFDASCQATVPAAIICFLDGVDFEDVIRNAVSLGGDTDTTACIAGSLAEAVYDIPENMLIEAYTRLPYDLRELAVKNDKKYGVDYFKGKVDWDDIEE